MTQNFTDAVANALQQAFEDAQNRKNTEVTDNHLLASFLKDSEGYFNTFLASLKTNPSSLLKEVEQHLNRLPTFSGTTTSAPATAQNLQSRIADAQSIAQKWKDSYLSSDHFLFSYWRNGGEPFEKWKKGTGISLSEVEDANQKNSRRPSYGFPRRRS